MKKVILSIAIFSIVTAGVAFFSFPKPAYATTGTTTGTIQNIYTYGSGFVLITGFTFSGSSCTNNGGFFVSNQHPKLTQMLGVLLFAKSIGASLSVTAKIDNCWYPELTSDDTTYFVLQ